MQIIIVLLIVLLASIYLIKMQIIIVLLIVLLASVSANPELNNWEKVANFYTNQQSLDIFVYKY
jgi:hypothetical protein